MMRDALRAVVTRQVAAPSGRRRARGLENGEDWQVERIASGTLRCSQTYTAASGMFISMRVKTSITISEDLLKQIDRASGNRSDFLERAAWRMLAELERARRNSRDAFILNKNSERLNKEALEVLKFQNLS